MPSKQSSSFFYLILVVFVFIFGAELFTKGLFVDGIFYGAVAQSLTDGYGSFWELSATKHFAEPFYGHPPLGIWLLSSWMWLFDSAFWVERLFSFFNLVFLLLGMAKIWQITNKSQAFQSTWWLWLIWLTLPINIWSYHQYMLENTMAVFVVWAVYWGLKAGEGHRIVLYSCLSGGMIFLATFTKGPVGLFPLVVLVLHGLIFRMLSWQKTLLCSLLMLLCVLLPYALLLLLSTDASTYFNEYYTRQMVRSLTDTNLETNGHFFIFKPLFVESIAAWLILLAAYWGLNYKWKELKERSQPQKIVLFFVLLTFAGTLPMMISPKQMRFYIVPALPFLALAAAHLSYPLVQHLLQKIPENSIWGRYAFIINSLLLVVACTFTIQQYGTYTRDQTIIKDITTLSEVIPPYTQAILRTKEPAYGAECYFMRIGKIAVHGFRWGRSNELEKENPTPYFIIEKTIPVKGFSKYKLTREVQMKNWNLYLLKPES